MYDLKFDFTKTKNELNEDIAYVVAKMLNRELFVGDFMLKLVSENMNYSMKPLLIKHGITKV